MAFISILRGEEIEPFDHKLVDKNGREMEVKVIGVTENGLEVRRASDGKEFSVSENILSAADREICSKLRATLKTASVSGSDNKPEIGREAGEQTEVSISRGRKVKMNWCPPGAYQVGCCPVEERSHESCFPLITFQFTKGFWMGATEVTQRQWNSIMGSNTSRSQGGNLPVENVSWLQAQKFVTEINASGLIPDGWRVALPSDTQWTYACRAGTVSELNSGKNLEAEFKDGEHRSKNLEEVGWYAANSAREINPVARKKPNSWGLYDMHGNVAELCASTNINSATPDLEIKAAAPMVDLQPDESLELRPALGGSVRHYATQCVSGANNGFFALDMIPDGDGKSKCGSAPAVGIRLVMVADDHE